MLKTLIKLTESPLGQQATLPSPPLLEKTPMALEAVQRLVDVAEPKKDL